MTPNVERGRRLAAWLGVACLGLVPVSSLSAQEPKLRATLQGHTNAVVAVAFSPDSKTLASASYDGTLKLWDMTTGKERATLGEYKGCLGCVAFSPDGKTLASGAIGSPGPFPDLKQRQVVGRGHRQGTDHPQGEYLPCPLRGIQPGWQDPGLGERRRQALGPGHQQGASHPPGAYQRGQGDERTCIRCRVRGVQPGWQDAGGGEP